ncbi:MAG: glucose-6-phosphate isomerase [Bdellovibrio sp.]|nr:glucose-6-phosphate isomerase [Bdellovibrio sp.]
MAITASRLGHSPITLDWTHLPRKYDLDLTSMTEVWGKLKARLSSHDVGFFDSPHTDELNQVKPTCELATLLLEKKIFTDCLFLGIGGSALGPISLIEGLKDRSRSGIRFHFLENPDPVDWKYKTQSLRKESTLVCVVTKSGATVETMAQTALALEWLGRSLWKTHFVAITDPKKGDLRELAQQEGLMALSIHPSLGGRYSVFSPVGLFPAALAGLDISSFLLGAAQVRDYFEKTAEKSGFEKNPVFILAHELIRYFPARSVHVCMPYATRLKSVGSWFTQLWAESLGKNGKGFTPLSALGAVDQHSILQLLRDGPDDKVTFFITVDRVDDEVKIPKSIISQDRRGYPTLKLLEGHTLHELLRVEYQAISLVLTKQNRPHISIGIDQLDERSFGALYFMFCTLTAITGVMWEVDPFDQPGVEEGKVYIHQALSQGGEGSFSN